MTVYDGFTHFVTLKEETKYAKEVQGKLVNISVNEQGLDADTLIRRYVEQIMHYVKENPEELDVNSLRCTIIFLQLGSRRLEIQFTGVNMNEGRYEKLDTALICMVALIISEHFAERTQEKRYAELAKECLDIADKLLEELRDEQPERLDWPELLSMQESVHGANLRLCCWATEFYEQIDIAEAVCCEHTLSVQREGLYAESLDLLAGQIRKIIEEKGECDRVVVIKIPAVEMAWLFEFVTGGIKMSIELSQADMLRLRYSIAQGLSCASGVMGSEVGDEVDAYLDSVLRDVEASQAVVARG